MKYLHLVLSNLLRKKTRTALTAGSFAVALFLFGILAVVDGASTGWSSSTGSRSSSRCRSPIETGWAGSPA
jgi:predicted lysophospholipase L1 biosynthesis ABC-type transport system permease subunit